MERVNACLVTSYAALVVGSGPLPAPYCLMPFGPGSLPPAPPPRLAAALDGGLLPCLERLLRRAASNPEDSRTVSFVDYVFKYSGSVHCGGHCFLPLLAYGDVEQSRGLLSALRCLMHLPGCGGSSGSSSGGGSSGGGRGDGGGSSGGGGGGGGNAGGGSGGSSSGQQIGKMLEQCAAAFVSQLLVTPAPGPDTGPTPGLGNGGSCGCDPVPAAPSTSGLSPAQLPLPPPPGLPRLHYMYAHAVRLLLPPLSRFACRHATAGASEEQSKSVREMVGGNAAAVIRLVILLLALQIKRSGCTAGGSSGGNGNGGGSGDGGGDDSSNGGGGSTVARLKTQSDASPLARFLFDEMGVVELLAAVPRLVPRLSGSSVPGLASAVSCKHAEALCGIASSFPDQVRELVMKPAGGSGSGGGAAAVWRTGPLRRAVSELRLKRMEEQAEAVEALISLIKVWRDGGETQQARGVGVGKGRVVAEAEVKAAGELAVLRAAVGRLQLSREFVPDGMGRALLEVLSQ